METLLSLIAAAAVGGCIAAVVSWSRAKTAAADAATAREVAERHAAEAEERLAASERESRAARERAEAEIRTLIEARTKAEAAAEALERKIREGKAEREQAEELQRTDAPFQGDEPRSARPAAETFQREYRRFPHARRADLFDRTRAARRVEG